MSKKIDSVEQAIADMKQQKLVVPILWKMKY